MLVQVCLCSKSMGPVTANHSHQCMHCPPAPNPKPRNEVAKSPLLPFNHTRDRLIERNRALSACCHWLTSRFVTVQCRSVCRAMHLTSSLLWAKKVVQTYLLLLSVDLLLWGHGEDNRQYPSPPYSKAGIQPHSVFNSLTLEEWIYLTNAPSIFCS